MRIVGRRGASSPDTPRAGTGARRLRGVVGRGAGRRWAGAGTASVVALPLVLMSLFGAGSPQAEVVASTGAAWVASPALGLVSLIDGPSQEVAAALAVPPADSRLTVEQAGSSAYVVDPGAGTVTRIDGAVQEATPPTPIGVPGGELTVLQGGGEVYVLDATRRTVTLIDPVTLERRREVPLGAAPGPGQAVVDDRGRLWVVDGDAGGLSRFDGSLHVEPDAAGAQDRLVLVDGRPVLVDAAAASIAPVSDSGGVGRPSCLRIGADDEVQLVGSPDGGLVLAAIAATGTLVTGTVGTDDCARVVRLVDPGTPVDFGPLVHRGDFVLVPNRATGETIVVDLREDTVAVRLPLTPPGNQLQLIGRGPLVFYNDLDGDTAGVLTFDGDSWVAGDPVRKYDPDTGEPASVTTPDAGGVTPGPGTSPGAGSGAPPSGAPPSDTPEARLPDTPQARLPDLPGADPATPDPARAGSPPPGPGGPPPRVPGVGAGPAAGRVRRRRRRRPRRTRPCPS